jgi:hypothetical protein
MSQSNGVLRCCGNCRWWLPDDNTAETQVGECHGGPPTAIVLTEKNTITRKLEQKFTRAWAPTHSSECCAHFSLCSNLKKEQENEGGPPHP